MFRADADVPASACPSETEEATSERDDLNDDVEDVEDMDQEEDVNVVDVISGLDTKSIDTHIFFLLKII